MDIFHIVGARPNFMKVAPVFRAFQEYRTVRQIVIHTGQHYDFNMSDVFFQQLGMASPDINLQVGSGTHARQTAQIMTRFEEVVLQRKPELVLVYGDVNSTVAAALVCAKIGIELGHVEAGLRSCDRSMPEEINRVLTDQMADVLFTPSEDGNRNLAKEGVSPERIHLVGNVMIDTLVRMLPAARQRIPAGLPERFVLLTLHRPSNVDDREWLCDLLACLEQVGREVPILFPVHPRTRERLYTAGLADTGLSGLRLMEPLSYLEFLGLQTRATVVITDSGGIQEETTYLGIPCLTVRDNTERPVTVTDGTNILVGRNLTVLLRELGQILMGRVKKGTIPPLWDGHAAERIAQTVMKGTARPALAATGG